jgi:hypothetical protein
MVTCTHVSRRLPRRHLVASTFNTFNKRIRRHVLPVVYGEPSWYFFGKNIPRSWVRPFELERLEGLIGTPSLIIQYALGMRSAFPENGSIGCAVSTSADLKVRVSSLGSIIPETALHRNKRRTH